MTGRPVILLMGVIWLFSAVHPQLPTMANSYLHFGMVTGLVFVIDGLVPSIKPAK